MQSHFETRVANFISTHHLMTMGPLYLAALSGGADSVAMLLLLVRLGYRVEAMHCNFHLRGDESDRDEAFCRQLCQGHGIPLHVVHFDTHAYADLHKVSIEMAARNLRYTYFEQLRRDLHAEGVCVAHHRDDQVETVLLNLVRGTGLHGLTGMAPRRDHILRPLLSVSRADIVAWLEQQEQDFVTDSTNLVPDVQRNKLRLQAIPLLRTVNPAASDNIARTALRLAEAERVFNRALEEGEARATERLDDHGMPLLRISLSRLLEEPSPEYLLFRILQPLQFTPQQIEQISGRLSQLATGSEWRSPSHQLVADRGSLLAAPLPSSPLKPMKLPEGGNYVLPSGDRLKVSRMQVDADFQLVKDRMAACLDADLVAFPLTVRPVAEADRFVPFGMRGSKLVSDYLTDRKMSLIAKRRQLVVADASERIVWLVGERPDGRFTIGPHTAACLLLQFSGSSAQID